MITTCEDPDVTQPGEEYWMEVDHSWLVVQRTPAQLGSFGRDRLSELTGGRYTFELVGAACDDGLQFWQRRTSSYDVQAVETVVDLVVLDLAQGAIDC